MIASTPDWSRRAWVTSASSSASLLYFGSVVLPRSMRPMQSFRASLQRRKCDLPSAAPLPPGPMQALALRAVDAARSAGAQYADVRVTRVVQHEYECLGVKFSRDIELVAVGVRALVNGYWGFTASPFWTNDAVVHLAQNAVAQAATNAKGPPRTVDLGHIPVVTGTWVTPIVSDPFAIPIEEKLDHILYWKNQAAQCQVPFYANGLPSSLQFVRQERVVATSEGSLVTQTCYETSGAIICSVGGGAADGAGSSTRSATGLDVAGKGWELFLEANLPEQFLRMQADGAPPAVPQRPAIVGRYTIVCDGATVAAIVDKSLGLATQLDRALGYEANGGGTSFIEDPLDAVGTRQIASPLVTLTANRSAPAQLATVHWDDEGVVPQDFPLINDGVLVDFQTTREQAGWLAPYYQRRGRAVQSHGCAASETALTITMQHMPNLAIAPATSATTLAELVRTVQQGILLEGAYAECDWQGRSGTLEGGMREITNGQLGARLRDGVIAFETEDLWKHLIALGGPSTVGRYDSSQYNLAMRERKGQPKQATSHSVRAPAAVFANQPVLDPSRGA